MVILPVRARVFLDWWVIWIDGVVVVVDVDVCFVIGNGNAAHCLVEF